MFAYVIHETMGISKASVNLKCSEAYIWYINYHWPLQPQRKSPVVIHLFWTDLNLWHFISLEYLLFCLAGCCVTLFCRLASLESHPTHIVSSCIDLTTALAKFTPALVIENLSQHFLPVLVSSGSDVTNRPWEAEIEKSWFGHLIEVECSLSKWDHL